MHFDFKQNISSFAQLYSDKAARRQSLAQFYRTNCIQKIIPFSLHQHYHCYSAVT